MTGTKRSAQLPEDGIPIIMTGTIAAGAVSGALADKREELMARFPSFFAPFSRFDYALRNREEMEAERRAVADAVSGQNPAYLLPLGKGGILKGLWDLGEASGCGLRVYMKKIPVRQETIEICEYFGWNPYEADSEGACLIAAPSALRIQPALSDRGIPNALIGMLTREKGKILDSPGRIRYINKPFISMSQS